MAIAIPYGDITPVYSLPAFYFTVFHLRTHTPPSQQATAGWVTWAATLLIRSRLLEGVGGPCFGSVQGCDRLLTPATIDTVVRIFGYD